MDSLLDLDDGRPARPAAAACCWRHQLVRADQGRLPGLDGAGHGAVQGRAAGARGARFGDNLATGCCVRAEVRKRRG